MTESRSHFLPLHDDRVCAPECEPDEPPHKSSGVTIERIEPAAAEVHDDSLPKNHGCSQDIDGIPG